MEGVAIDHFNKLKPSTTHMLKFHSHLSDDGDKDDSTTATYHSIILQFILTKQMIDPFLTIMWYHMDGCAKQYRCASEIYLLSCLNLEFYIVVDR